MNPLQPTPQMSAFKDTLIGSLLGTYESLQAQGRLRQADGGLPARVQEGIRQTSGDTKTSSGRESILEFWRDRWIDLNVLYLDEKKKADLTKGYACHAVWLYRQIHPVLAEYTSGLVGNQTRTPDNFKKMISFYNYDPEAVSPLEELFGYPETSKELSWSFETSPNMGSSLTPDHPDYRPVQLALCLDADFADPQKIFAILEAKIAEGGIVIFHSQTEPNLQQSFFDGLRNFYARDYKVEKTLTEPLFDAPESRSATLILRRKPVPAVSPKPVIFPEKTPVPGNSGTAPVPTANAPKKRERFSASEKSTLKLEIDILAHKISHPTFGEAEYSGVREEIKTLTEKILLSEDPELLKKLSGLLNNKFSRETVDRLSTSDLNKAAQGLDYLSMETLVLWTNVMFMLFEVENVHTSHVVQKTAKDLRIEITSRLANVQSLFDKPGENPRYRGALPVLLFYNIAKCHPNTHVRKSAEEKLDALAKLVK